MFQAQARIDGLARPAEALAEAIQGTPEWEEWQGAKAAFENDRSIAESMRRYQELWNRWRRAQAWGGGLMGKEAMGLAEVQEKIQQHELFLWQQEAGGALVAVFQRTNELISAQLGVDFAANAVPPSGRCCG